MAKALVMALVLAVLVMAEPGQAAVECSKVRSQLAPCAAYLTGSSPNPLPTCCNGVQYIKDNTVTKADRQSTCQCLKDTATQMSNLKDSAAQQLANKCNIQIDVPISRTVDCNKI